MRNACLCLTLFLSDETLTIVSNALDTGAGFGALTVTVNSGSGRLSVLIECSVITMNDNIVGEYFMAKLSSSTHILLHIGVCCCHDVYTLILEAFKYYSFTQFSTML